MPNKVTQVLSSPFFHTARCKISLARLVSQGYKKNHLSNTFKKFYDRYSELFGKYRVKLSDLLLDAGLSESKYLKHKSIQT